MPTSKVFTFDIILQKKEAQIITMDPDDPKEGLQNQSFGIHQLCSPRAWSLVQAPPQSRVNTELRLCYLGLCPVRSSRSPREFTASLCNLSNTKLSAEWKCAELDSRAAGWIDTNKTSV